VSTYPSSRAAPTQIEDISNLLNTGEVPNLFDTGDMIAIGENVRTRARASRMDGSRADLFAFFVQEVRCLCVCVCLCVYVGVCVLQEIDGEA
jgi:hypothetical protein